MFVKALALIAALAAATPAKAQDDVHEHAPTGVLGDCDGRGWDDPAPPVHVYANVYDIGTCGITALLIASPEGHVVIDAADTPGAQIIAGNIAALGFDPKDVKLLLLSHEHFDHSGGLAELAQITGAPVAALPHTAELLKSGKADPADPQASELRGMAPVAVTRIVHDGEVMQVGPIAVTIHATPAHAPGSASYTWESCASGTCQRMAYVDSLTTFGLGGYRFTDHPQVVAAARAAFAKVAALPCDIVMSPHPQATSMYQRIEGDKPLVDADGCKAYAQRAEAGLDRLLAKEASQ
ncbi:subclass B3 metallo-beta-lactamase [Croceicoccus mobilis]|uniref:CAU/MBL1b family subclass B3 metallo-beta-lactamase n=1 Tax=Croceicoccus mobilis TaxID=1703339 RepID=A0A916YQ83_9SPHN|nr:subclass B3 metallo-beta-lactamase [Croceicoccus mobilis]GGD55196.1 CAU/MBL1b family subclass B3 metallo-beta-lactamase [Croceicoccus mobilis]